jgi:hypothetical protein
VEFPNPAPLEVLEPNEKPVFDAPKVGVVVPVVELFD